MMRSRFQAPGWGSRVLIVAVASVLALGLSARTQAIAAPANNNGNAKIAASPCERALNAIAGKGQIKKSSTESAGLFGCSAGSITVEMKKDKRTTQRIIGNTRTLQSRDVTGLKGASLSRAENDLGISSGKTSIQSTMPPNTCLAGTPEVSIFTDSPFQAHANIGVCYGRFIFRGFPIPRPVEVIWSDVLDFQWTQSITSRKEHSFKLINLSTSAQHSIGIYFTWDQRMTVSGDIDPYVGESETLEALPFDTGAIASSTYYTSWVKGTYHLTNTNLAMNILDTGETMSMPQNIRMPDFDCDFVDEPGICSFQ